MGTQQESVAVIGASGFIGQALCCQLLAQGYKVHAVGRSKAHLQAVFGEEQADIQLHDYSTLREIDAHIVVNLAGENIAAKRWSAQQKDRLLSSRLSATEQVNVAVKRWPSLHTFINASAIGIYGDGGDRELNENSPIGRGFSAELCQRWEESINSPCRTIVARFAVVLDRDRDAGALAKMRPAFSLGVGAYFGHGKQWQAYIHRHDAVKALLFFIENKELEGAFNISGPEPVTNREFSQLLASKLRRPLLFSIPEFAAKILFGEMRELFYSSQRIIPDGLLKAGFSFDFPTIDRMLDDALQHPERHQ